MRACALQDFGNLYAFGNGIAALFAIGLAISFGFECCRHIRLCGCCKKA